MTRKQFYQVMEKFNLRLNEQTICYKHWEFAELYVFTNNEYLVRVYKNDYNFVEKGPFIQYVQNQIIKFKKEEVKEKLYKLREDFKND